MRQTAELRLHAAVLRQDIGCSTGLTGIVNCVTLVIGDKQESNILEFSASSTSTTAS